MDKELNILLIEDNPADSRLIEEYLKDSGDLKFNLLVADRLSTGLDYISKGSLDIVLVDLALPDSQGIETAERVLEKVTDHPVIVLTGLDDMEKTKDALQKGLQDYLVKGQFDGHFLVKSIIFSIERKKTEVEINNLYNFQKTLIENIPVMQYNISPNDIILDCNKLVLKTLGYDEKNKLIGKKLSKAVYAPSSQGKAKKVLFEWKKCGQIKNEELQVITGNGKIIDVLLNVNSICNADGKVLYSISTHLDISEIKKARKDLEKSNIEIKNTLTGILDSLSMLVEIRDPYTSGHQKKVGNLAMAIAKEYGLEKDKIDNLITAAQLHDIGKIHIPISILSMPGKISEIQMGLIKDHPKKGYEIIKNINFHPSIAKMILQHHERLDGSGYPGKLKDKEIIFGAKIIGVADVIEAMSSNRPYRPALGIPKAIDELKKNKGILYDSIIADICIKLFKEKRFGFQV